MVTGLYFSAWFTQKNDFLIGQVLVSSLGKQDFCTQVLEFNSMCKNHNQVESDHRVCKITAFDPRSCPTVHSGNAKILLQGHTMECG